jgi:protein-S-isoprenylcysteine O-methyltransferase Ste14
MKSLLLGSLTSVVIVVAVMAALIFVPAGTLDYWQAWALLALFGATSLAAVVHLNLTDPDLLHRRLRGGPMAETRLSQKIIMWIASGGYCLLLVASGLDHRRHGSVLPFGMEIAADIVFVAGFAMVITVFRENSFTSATIELAPDQRVITTGPYAVVRHPMYASSFLYLLAMPIALGSLWGLAAMILIAPAVIWRLLDEERFLAENLAGYTEYRDKTRYRLVPFVW